MKTLPLSDVKAHLSGLADEVIRTHERVTVTRNGREAFVMLSVADMESIEATMELLADAESQARVAQSQAEPRWRAAAQAIRGPVARQARYLPGQVRDQRGHQNSARH